MKIEIDPGKNTKIAKLTKGEVSAIQTAIAVVGGLKAEFDAEGTCVETLMRIRDNLEDKNRLNLTGEKP